MRKQTIIVGVLVVVIVCFVMAQPNATQTRTIPKTENGRWQIVNGTPELAHNIMLLDTQTGDTWITCGNKESTDWCSMSRGYVQAAPKPPEP